MSSSNLNDSTEDSERYSEPLRARSSPYDYRVTVRFEGRSLDVYHGKSPTSAMGAYGQAVRRVAHQRRGHVQTGGSLAGNPDVPAVREGCKGSPPQIVSS